MNCKSCWNGLTEDEELDGNEQCFDCRDKGE